MLTPKLIIIAAGGHSKVVIDALLASRRAVDAIVDTDPRKHGTQMLGITVVGDDSFILGHACNDVELVNGVGSIKDTSMRQEIFDRFKARGYGFATVVHPSAVIAPSASLAEGSQIMAGAVIQADVVVGANTIVNTKASVDHDSVLGAHVHVAPGCTLSGGVIVGDGAHLGAGAVVLEGRRLGERCLVAAGAVVVDDVPAHAAVAGVPAKPIGRAAAVVPPPGIPGCSKPHGTD